MAVLDTAINAKTFYRFFIEEQKEQLNALEERQKVLSERLAVAIDTCKELIPSIFETYRVNLLTYKEFVDNVYIDGEFYKVAEGVFVNRKKDYKLSSEAFQIYRLARMQKELNQIKKDIEYRTKLSELPRNKYFDYVRSFMMEVHKQLIIDGNGFSFGDIGWFVINRCKSNNSKPTIDYKATKERKEEFIAQGKKLYSKEEEEWCVERGIKYEVEDYRVFQHHSYFYEIAHIDCKLPKSRYVTFKVPYYRSPDLIKLKYEDFIKQANGDPKVIVTFGLDIKAKLAICLKLDDMLYLNYIRNENQESVAHRSSNRKDRQ